MLVNDIKDLTDDGDEFELPDGQMLKVVFAPDDSASLSDYPDWSGEITGWYRYAYGGRRKERPSHFNGRARKLHTRDMWAWWQPPTDLPDDGLKKFQHLLQEIAEYGYIGITLEIDGAHVAGLWGIEWCVEREYAKEVIAELVAELPEATFAEPCVL